ncbi:uncharacterized protein [Lolium perenne]|uniref:uncharacterized protein n=1 Tax=Lolium perenne TaxID=4522 RepID=UPI0021F65DBC|nr:uncharacterized protein LOC127330381 [Lolium perenne]
MSDEVVWHCIRHGHCSFMAKFTTGILCRNPYNVTGICNRSSCPLANSRYATIRDHDGIFYLYMKTPERAHMPNKLWERVKLPKNYEDAMEVINKHLEFWPKLLVLKNKQRLTKMTQYRIRMRKLQLKVREKVMTVPRKKIQRDRGRMEKAERAAQIDKSITSELLERLNRNMYGDIPNIPLKPSRDFIDEMDFEYEEEHENEIEYVEGDGIEEDMEDMVDFQDLCSDKYGGIDQDDLIHQPVTKKQRGTCSVSSSRPIIGTKSRKVITEVEEDEHTKPGQRTLA